MPTARVTAFVLFRVKGLGFGSPRTLDSKCLRLDIPEKNQFPNCSDGGFSEVL